MRAPQPSGPPAGTAATPAVLSAAFPVLTVSQLARLRAYGTCHPIKKGQSVFAAGDATYDLVLIDDGAIDIVRAATRDAPQEVVASHGDLGEVWTALGRRPLPFETSMPGVFAAGDVRHGSMKRVAAAVGDGAGVVGSVHTAIGMHP